MERARARIAVVQQWNVSTLRFRPVARVQFAGAKMRYLEKQTWKWV